MKLIWTNCCKTKKRGKFLFFCHVNKLSFSLMKEFVEFWVVLCLRGLYQTNCMLSWMHVNTCRFFISRFQCNHNHVLNMSQKSTHFFKAACVEGDRHEEECLPLFRIGSRKNFRLHCLIFLNQFHFRLGCRKNPSEFFWPADGNFGRDTTHDRLVQCK